MMRDFVYIQQLLGHGSLVWLSATLFAGLLLVLAFRPDAIRIPTIFRAACWALALAVVVPSFLLFLLSLHPDNYAGDGMERKSAEMAFFMAFSNFSGPLLQGAAIICALTALMPPITRHDAPTGPAKHPLDET
jgi:hypothetical protein